jgi:ABC-type phosphate/phosphonate transport system ATPase subunit
MAEDFLKIQNVSKLYAGVQALDNVSMSIGQGEVHCLVDVRISSNHSVILRNVLCDVRISSFKVFMKKEPKR